MVAASTVTFNVVFVCVCILDDNISFFLLLLFIGSANTSTSYSTTAIMQI